MTTKTDAEKYNELLDATTKLLIAIRQTINHPEYQKVWQLYQSHGFKYTGPDYAAQAAAAYDVIVNHAAAEVEADATLPLFKEDAPIPEGACCANEDRNMAGGCRNCGAPSL